jgi:hypothetical protein
VKSSHNDSVSGSETVLINFHIAPATIRALTESCGRRSRRGRQRYKSGTVLTNFHIAPATIRALTESCGRRSRQGRQRYKSETVFINFQLAPAVIRALTESYARRSRQGRQRYRTLRVFVRLVHFRIGVEDDRGQRLTSTAGHGAAVGTAGVRPSREGSPGPPIREARNATSTAGPKCGRAKAPSPTNSKATASALGEHRFGGIVDSLICVRYRRIQD